MIRPPQGPNDDSLVLENVPPGRYWLRLNSSRGYAGSATMGSTDLLREPLVVGLGSTAPIEITMRDSFSTVEGSVADMPSDPASERLRPPQAWIYFVPLPDSAGQYQQANVFSNGKFTTSLTPGSYRVLTFPHQHFELPYRDAEAMRPYENKGQVIHVTAGQKTTLQLNMISGDE
jgi:hypothetical protein